MIPILHKPLGQINMSFLSLVICVFFSSCADSPNPDQLSNEQVQEKIPASYDSNPDYQLDQFILNKIPAAFNPDIASPLKGEKDDFTTELIFHLSKSRCFLYRDARLDSAEYYLNLITNRMDDADSPRLPGVRVAVLIDHAFLQLQKYGNFSLGLTYANQALLESNGASNSLKVEALIICAKLHYSAFELEKCFEYLEKIHNLEKEEVLSKLQKLHTASLEVAYFNNSKAIGKDPKAHETKDVRFLKSDQKLKELRNLGPRDPIVLAEYYRLAGIRYSMDSQFEKSGIMADSSLYFFEILEWPDRYSKANAFFEQTTPLHFLGKYSEAMPFYNSAMSTLFGENFISDDLKESMNSVQLILGEAQTLKDWALKEQSIKTAELAIRKYESAASLLTHFRIYDKESLIRHNRYFSNLYTYLIQLQGFMFEETGDEKWIKEMLLSLAKFKNELLRYEMVLQKNFYHFEDQPDHPISKISMIEQKYELLLLKEASEDDFGLDHYLEKNKLIRDKQSLFRYLKRSSPDIYGEFFETPMSLIDDIIGRSKVDKIVRVYYHIGNTWFNKKKIYVIVLNQGKLSLRPIPHPDKVEQQIEQYSQQFSNKLKTLDQTPQEFSEISKALYDVLCKDDFEDFPENSKIQLFLDHKLNRVPYATLVRSLHDSSDATFASLDYMVNHFDIQYRFTVLENLQDNWKKEFDSAPIYAMAYSSKSTAFEIREPEELLSSFMEVEMLQNEYPSGFFTMGIKSDRENFFKYAPRKKRIHISTHSYSSDDNRLSGHFLLRSKSGVEPVYLNEISFKSIFPQQVVISACQSASGLVGQEEGIFSLARALYAAGSEQIVSSIWDLDDEIAVKLFRSYYSSPSSTRSISEIQRQYIQSCKGIACHPFYWGGVLEHE